MKSHIETQESRIGKKTRRVYNLETKPYALNLSPKDKRLWKCHNKLPWQKMSSSLMVQTFRQPKANKQTVV